jgi:hypothetical protein
MEINILENLAFPGGIAAVCGVIIQYLKSKLKKSKLKINQNWHSLLIIGLNLGICGILAWIGYFALDLVLKDAFWNWMSAWIFVSFGYQLIKGAGKTKKQQ